MSALKEWITAVTGSDLKASDREFEVQRLERLAQGEKPYLHDKILFLDALAHVDPLNARDIYSRPDEEVIPEIQAHAQVRLSELRSAKRLPK